MSSSEMKASLLNIFYSLHTWAEYFVTTKLLIKSIISPQVFCGDFYTENADHLIDSHMTFIRGWYPVEAEITLTWPSETRGPSLHLEEIGV